MYNRSESLSASEKEVQHGEPSNLQLKACDTFNQADTFLDTEGRRSHLERWRNESKRESGKLPRAKCKGKKNHLNHPSGMVPRKQKDSSSSSRGANYKQHKHRPRHVCNALDTENRRGANCVHVTPAERVRSHAADMYGRREHMLTRWRTSCLSMCGVGRT